MAVSIYERIEKMNGGMGVALPQGSVTHHRQLEVLIKRIDPERPLVEFHTTDAVFSNDTRGTRKTRFDLDLTDPNLGDDEIVLVKIKVLEDHVSFIPDVDQGGTKTRYAVSGSDSETEKLIKKCDLIMNPAGRYDEVRLYCGKLKGIKKTVSYNLGFVITDLDDDTFTLPVIYDPDVKNDG